MDHPYGAMVSRDASMVALTPRTTSGIVGERRGNGATMRGFVHGRIEMLRFPNRLGGTREHGVVFGDGTEVVDSALTSP